MVTRKIDFGYGSFGSDDDHPSRFKGLKEGSTSRVEYTYFGMDTFCEQEYPENAVKFTYIGTPDSNGDPYRGLDRFGRVIDQKWVNGSDNNLERLKYAYTRTNNRTERDNTVGSGQHEEYTYAEPAKSRRSESGGEETAARQFIGNGLDRFDDMERGTLNNPGAPGITNKNVAQDWGDDPLI